MTALLKASQLAGVTRFRSVRMVVTGACNSIVDLALLNLLLLAGLASSETGRLAATGIAYCAASLNAYFWHDRWVFASNLGLRLRPVVWFGGVGLVTFTANTFGVLSLARLLDQPAIGDLAAVNIAKLLVLGLTALVSYGAYASLVFRDRLQAPERAVAVEAATDQPAGAG